MDISFKEVPFKRSLSQNDTDIEKYETTLYRLKINDLFNKFDKTKNIINNLPYYSI